jgi:tryptophan synthase alpha chain
VSLLFESFAKAKRENRALLIGYLTAGFPTLERCKSAIAALIAGGVDVIEVGFPYSDPVMDGPVIQEASQIALANGIGAKQVFEVVASSSVPTLVMSYWNPIERFGVDSFANNLKAAGGCGVITPDLTIEESSEWIQATEQSNLDRVYVVAPSTKDARLAQVTSRCSGFVYAASLMGVTGTRNALSGAAESLVRRVRNVTETPVAVGLGVSNGQQAGEIAQYADGVIVGSAFIKLLLQIKDEEQANQGLTDLARGLSLAVNR